MCCAKNTKRPCVDLRFRHDRISLGAIAFPNVPLRLPQDRRPALRRGWDVVEQYHDAGISGAKGRDGRPDLDQMLKDASRRKFDVIMVWAIDRLGRSLIDLLGAIQTLEACGVDLYLDQQSDHTGRQADVSGLRCIRRV